MCGVVKRPQDVFANIPSQYCGTAVLDSTGRCTVALPDDFPDEERIVRETMRAAPFCIVYSLTAMRCSMPSLYVSREVGRISKLSPGKRAGASVDSTPPAKGLGTAASSQSPGPGGVRDKKRRAPKNFGGAVGIAMRSGSRDSSTPGSPPEGVRGTITRDRGQERRDQLSQHLPRIDNVPQFVNSNVVKSASISDFRLVPGGGSLADSRNNSTSNLQLLHNDRLIDGPLPLTESFQMINRYSQQIRSGISESIFRLTLGTLAFEERVGESGAPANERHDPDAQLLKTLQEGDEPASMCGALNAEDRMDSFGVHGSSASTIQLAPLTFVISGGVPGGTVSWVVHTAPTVASGAAIEGGALADGDAEGVPAEEGTDRPRSYSGVSGGSTGIIRGGGGLGGATTGAAVSRGGSSPALNTLEDAHLAAQQRGDFDGDYALDWRAIS
jgi:hypothetical protein